MEQFGDASDAEFNIRCRAGFRSRRRAMLRPRFSVPGKSMYLRHADRVWPILFPFPYKATDDVNIQLPADG